MSATPIVLGTGRLTWRADERRSDRYGAVYLINSGDSMSSDFDPVRLTLPPGLPRGYLRAEVLETRQSTHIGDFFRGLWTSTPAVGEIITLGQGQLFSEPLTYEGKHYTPVGCCTDDNRGSDWLDQKALYRLHEQTVRLYVDPDPTVRNVMSKEERESLACVACQGTGTTHELTQLERLVSLIMLAGEAAANDKPFHPYFNSTPLHGAPPAKRLAEVSTGLAGRAPRLFGHDSLDTATATRAILKAAGLPERWGWCEACNGEGYVKATP